MEELRTQIKQAVREDGTAWLEDLLRSCRAESEAGIPEASEAPEKEAERSAAQEREEERGRPKRRRNPPARLSPSPAAKRRSDRTSRGDERAKESGAVGRKKAPNSNRAPEVARARSQRSPTVGSMERRMGLSAAAGSGANEQRAVGRRTTRTGGGEERSRAEEASGSARYGRRLRQDGGAACRAEQVGAQGGGATSAWREKRHRGLVARGGIGGREPSSPSHSECSSASSTARSALAARRGGVSPRVCSESPRYRRSPVQVSGHRVINPLYASSSEGSVYEQQTRPRPASHDSTHEVSQRHRPGDLRPSRGEPASSRSHRFCYVNPKYVFTAADPSGYSSHSPASHTSDRRQGQNAWRRQKERSGREGFVRDSDSELGRVGPERGREAFREREARRGDRRRARQAFYQQESLRQPVAASSTIPSGDYIRRRRHENEQERPYGGYPGATQAGAAQRATRSRDRQPSNRQDSRTGSRLAGTTPLAMPEVGRAAAEPWKVWIIGHSYIYWAEKRAAVRPAGRSLNLTGAAVNWHGVRGLQWPSLLRIVMDISRWTPRRVVLVVHAGGNDLGRMKMRDLLVIMKQDLLRFRDCFQEGILVWSDIVARRSWRGVRDPEAIDRVRRLINLKISKFVQSLGGIAIRHWELEEKERGALRDDGVHLSDVGMDTFLSGLQDGVEMALARVGGVGRHA